MTGDLQLLFSSSRTMLHPPIRRRGIADRPCNRSTGNCKPSTLEFSSTDKRSGRVPRDGRTHSDEKVHNDGNAVCDIISRYTRPPRFPEITFADRKSDLA